MNERDRIAFSRFIFEWDANLADMLQEICGMIYNGCDFS